MGLILDSSVLITAERQGQNARQMLTVISRTTGNTDVALSVVTLIELAHGAARADTAERRVKRQQFIQELLTALPIHPVTVSVALRVASGRSSRNVMSNSVRIATVRRKHTERRIVYNLLRLPWRIGLNRGREQI